MTEQPAYLTGVEVEGVRCFREQVVVDLLGRDGRPSMWTVVLGENGVGKTTLAQVLVSVGRDYMDGRVPSSLVGVAATTTKSASVVLRFASGLVKESNVRGGPFPLNVPLSSGDARLGLLLVAFGAHRRPSQRELRDDLPGVGIETLFDDDAELLNAEEWQLRLKVDALLRDEPDNAASRELAAVQALLPRLLPDVESVDIPKPPPDRRPGDLRNLVVFRTADGDVPFSGLSLGYRTVAAMAVDMAARMFRHYPESADPLGEPAICVIDELDLHLHPRWQREVVGYLRSRFPRTQFIVTTHSPLIVQASGDDANLVVLARDADGVVRVDNDPVRVATWRVDQVLTSELFGLDSSRPPEVARKLDRRAELMNQKVRTDAEDTELAELRVWAAGLPTQETRADQDALDLLREVAARLKAGG